MLPDYATCAVRKPKNLNVSQYNSVNCTIIHKVMSLLFLNAQSAISGRGTTWQGKGERKNEYSEVIIGQWLDIPWNPRAETELTVYPLKK